MELTAGMYALGCFAVLAALLVVIVLPSLGIALVLSIPVFKYYLRTIAPGLMQAYTYDMAVVLIAFVGVLIHRLRHPSARISMPAGFIFCWLLIVVLMWSRLSASHSPEYGFKKCLIFSIFNSLACLVCFIYLTSTVRAKRVLQMGFLIGIIATVGLGLFGRSLEEFVNTRTTWLGASPLGVADACVHMIIIAFCGWIAQHNLRRLVLLIVVLPLGIYAIIKTGTRGGILLPPVGMMAALWMFRRRIGLGKVAGGVLVVIVTVAAYGELVRPDMLSRFAGGMVDAGFRIRLELADITWKGFLQNPIIGNGTGDTAYQISGAGAEDYPHNHILEIANELGVFGLCAYLGLIGYGLRAAWRMSGRAYDGTEEKPVGVAAFACFVYHFLVGMKAGTFSAAYLMYFFLTLTILIDQLARVRLVARQQEEVTDPYLAEIRTYP